MAAIVGMTAIAGMAAIAVTTASADPVPRGPRRRAAADWYVAALGAGLTSPLVPGPDGRVDHAELQLHGARLALTEVQPAQPDQPARSADSVVSPVTLRLEVDPVDVEDLIAAARAAGAQSDRPPGDTDTVRPAVFRDPFGHRWMVSTG